MHLAALQGSFQRQAGGSNVMDRKPQTEQKHPDEWQQDLNPDHMAGQNVGDPGRDTLDPEHTAYVHKELHRQLNDFSADDLKQVPVVPRGERLQQGTTYLDLQDPDREEFTATGEMGADDGHMYVPKSQTPYPLWNRLRGVEDPNRL
jgi:hypothetical protein